MNDSWLGFFSFSDGVVGLAAFFILAVTILIMLFIVLLVLGPRAIVRLIFGAEEGSFVKNKEYCDLLLQGKTYSGELTYEEDGLRVICRASLSWVESRYVFILHKNTEYVILKSKEFGQIEREIKYISPIRLEEMSL